MKKKRCTLNGRNAVAKTPAERQRQRRERSENEVIGLLIRKNYKELQKSLANTCQRCGQALPVSECIFDGENSCLLTTVRLKLAIKA